MSRNEQLVKVLSFWKEVALKGDLRSRDIVECIDVQTKEIVDIIGPRRSGKSSVLTLLVQKYHLGENFLSVNFEDPFFIEHGSVQVIEDLVEVYEEYFRKDLKYIFFDEIQNIDGWQRAVRKLRDLGKYKIFLTGSNSEILGGEVASAITGRHLSYQVFPLSFREFLSFQGVDVESLQTRTLQEKKIHRLFGEYMQLGGFPEVVLQKNTEILKQYFFDGIRRDIIARYDVRDKDALERMAVYFMTHSGKIVSVRSLEKAFSLSFESARDYLHYFLNAFLIFELKQFSYSLKKQSRTLKKIYAVDTGMANAVSFRFSGDRGRILETIVFLELARRGGDIFYYRTDNNHEVDFLVKEGEKVRDLVQVSWSLAEKETRLREMRSLMEAMDEVKISRATVVTGDEEELIKENGKEIQVIPAYKWLLK